ncbi:MAG: HlyD family secretion protein [Pseudohongiellaceae bacterium]
MTQPTQASEAKEPLYRPEALAYLGTRSFGQISIRQPLSLRLLTVGFVLIMLVMVLFVISNEYARKETVLGYLRPEPALIRVTTPAQGLVERIFTVAGSPVAVGDALLEISNERSMSSGENAGSVMLAELEAQRRRLQQELANINRQATLEQERNDNRHTLLQASMEQIDRERELGESRLQLAEEELAAAATLVANNYITESGLRQLQEQVLSAATALNNVEQRGQSLRIDLDEVRYLIDNTPLAREGQANRLRNELSELARRITDIESVATLLIRAPVAGTITALNTSVGDAVSGGRQLLTIIPDGAVLEARLMIPSRAAGFVDVGQPVRLMYDSFPYQKFGTYPGTVTAISEAALAPNTLSSPINPQEPVFVASVSIDETTVAAFGSERPLQADMLLTADIVLARRSLLDWMLEPFYTLRGRGE